MYSGSITIDEALTACGASALIQERISPLMDAIPRVDFNFESIEYNMEEKMNDSDLRVIALENAINWANAINGSRITTYTNEESITNAAQQFYGFLTASGPEYDDDEDAWDGDAWDRGFDAGYDQGYGECIFDKEEEAANETEADPIDVMAEALGEWLDGIKNKLPKVKLF